MDRWYFGMLRRDMPVSSLYERQWKYPGQSLQWMVAIIRQVCLLWWQMKCTCTNTISLAHSNQQGGGQFQCCIKIISFNVWVRYFVWNFKGYLWNSTQNILPIHWKMWILFTSENLRALNTLRPRQNGRHFPDDIFKCIFLFENIWIWIKISLKFVPKVRISNIPALLRIMAWHRIGDKPLSELVMVNLLTHIYVTRPQWVKRPPPPPWRQVLALPYAGFRV